MLLDFLFDQSNEINSGDALTIIASLLDLQEDYKYLVKRAFLKYILS